MRASGTVHCTSYQSTRTRRISHCLSMTSKGFYLKLHRRARNKSCGYWRSRFRRSRVKNDLSYLQVIINKYYTLAWTNEAFKQGRGIIRVGRKRGCRHSSSRYLVTRSSGRLNRCSCTNGGPHDYTPHYTTQTTHWYLPNIVTTIQTATMVRNSVKVINCFVFWRMSCNNFKFLFLLTWVWCEFSHV